MDAQETMRQHPALEVCAQLSLDETGNRLTPLASVGEKRFEMFADDLIQERLLRLAAFVLGHANPVRDRGWRQPKMPDVARLALVLARNGRCEDDCAQDCAGRARSGTRPSTANDLQYGFDAAAVLNGKLLGFPVIGTVSPARPL
jgi:hypothetical protein